MTYITSVHPGLVLADELEERGIEVDELASHIAVNPRALKQVCSGKRAITADLAVRLS